MLPLPHYPQQILPPVLLDHFLPELPSRASKTVELVNSGIAEGDSVTVGGKEYQFIDSASVGDAIN